MTWQKQANQINNETEVSYNEVIEMAKEELSVEDEFVKDILDKKYGFTEENADKISASGLHSITNAELMRAKIKAYALQIKNPLGELGDDYEVLDSIQHPNTGEEIELERVPCRHGSLYKWDDDRVVDIRGGNQIPAIRPKDTDAIEPSEFMRAYNKQHPEKRGLGEDDRVQGNWYSPVISHPDYSADEILNEKATITKGDALSKIYSYISKEEAEELFEQDKEISDLSYEEIIEIANIENKINASGDPEEMADHIKETAEDVDEVSDSYENNILSYPEIGIGGSGYYRYISCNKDSCSKCGTHGPYLYESVRDEQGNVQNNYIDNRWNS